MLFVGDDDFGMRVRTFLDEEEEAFFDCSDVLKILGLEGIWNNCYQDSRFGSIG